MLLFLTTNRAAVTSLANQQEGPEGGVYIPFPSPNPISQPNFWPNPSPRKVTQLRFEIKYLVVLLIVVVARLLSLAVSQ